MLWRNSLEERRPASRKTICLGIDCATINPAAQDMDLNSALATFLSSSSERLASDSSFLRS